MRGKSASGWLNGLCGLAVFVGAAGLAGCGSDSRQVEAPPVQPSAENASQTKSPTGAMISSADDFKTRLLGCKQQIDSTLAALSEVTNPNTTDLRGAYDKYSDQLARTERQAGDVKKEAEAMRSARQAYFASWEAKASEINNPTIRASAEARRQRLRDAHESIIANSEQLRDAYEPLMRDLQDVRKFLAPDLSKQSVSMLGDVSKKCQGDGAVVKTKIDAIVAELDKVESGQ